MISFSLPTRRFSRCFVSICVWPLLLVLGGCEGGSLPDRNELPDVLRLATTTSTLDSGLLDELIPDFEAEFKCRVDVIAVGTGAALKLGEAGDVDVLMVHAPSAERAFMNTGHGVRREQFMVNHFVVLGPPEDPAKVKGKSAPAALRQIAASANRFVSRGDNSGTHKRELSLWEQVGGLPPWDEYIECGQGMGAAMMVADEKRAYILADMGTYLRFADDVELDPLVVDDKNLRNPYAVIVVSPERTSGKRAALADAFAEFLIAAPAQRRISAYRLGDKQLFFPTRLKPSESTP